MNRIVDIRAREVLDSRGNPTVEAEVRTRAAVGFAIVPSGASTGSHEARELRDGGSRYFGLGVRHAVKNVNGLIRKRLRGMPIENQTAIDEAMLRLDGTKSKHRLGANAILAVSLASARCAAVGNQEEVFEHIGRMCGRSSFSIPVPCMNVINGGRHAANGLAFQEFMIVPRGKNFSDTVCIASEMYHALKTIIARKFGGTGTLLGDEGGFAPRVRTAREALLLLKEARMLIHAERKIGFAMDCAASEFFRDTRYYADGERFTTESFRNHLLRLVDDFGVESIEDPFDQDDFLAFRRFREALGGKARVVGDDLLCTDPARIRRAVLSRSCDTLLLKVNQIGTLTEAMRAAKLAQDAGWTVMVSHRSGETEDTFIADFAVGIGAEYIKAGAPARSERTAKYNRLLRIAEHRKVSGKSH